MGGTDHPEDVNRNVASTWWFILLRKVTLLWVATWLQHDRFQALFSVLITVIALGVHAFVQPYTDQRLDFLEWVSLFGSFFNYFFLQFLFDDVGLESKYHTVVVYLIFAFNVIVPIIFIIVLGKSLCEKRRETNGITKGKYLELDQEDEKSENSDGVEMEMEKPDLYVEAQESTPQYHEGTKPAEDANRIVEL